MVFQTGVNFGFSEEFFCEKNIHDYYSNNSG
jgi:hypothetical protein